MAVRSGLLRALISILVLFGISLAVHADTLRLKDGSLIKGKIVRFAGGTFTVVVGEGQRRRQLMFSAEEVESIQFDETASSLSSFPTPSTSTTERTTDAGLNRRSGTEETTSGTGGTVRVIRTDNTGRSAPVTDTQPKSGPMDNVPTRTTSAVKPVELKIKVLADNTANGWTNSGWVVKKGQRIRVIGSGQVSLGGGNTSTPAGRYDIEDEQKLLKNVPSGALIAVIGDDNNDFIYVGADREFVAARDGALFLGVNEGNLDDNAGAFDVTIQIFPGS